MKTIAVILSLDTKEREARFLKDFIERSGHRAFFIDVSTRGRYDFVPDVSRDEVRIAGGGGAGEASGRPKSEMIQEMMDGVKVIVPKLYAEGRFDAVLSAGGLQNTLMAAGAMQTLPIGVPKVIVSTVACGVRRFEQFTGIKDVLLLPSIADVAGLNVVSRTALSNAAAAVVGMAERAGRPLERDGRVRIGATLMGVTNASVVGALPILEREGFEVVCFHSTGVGGRYLENLIGEGVITAAMDVSLHEITSGDVFKTGFSAGATNRLEAGAGKGIPMVVAPGGLDFVDLYAEDFFGGAIGDPGKRKYNLHNSKIAHIKLFPEEARKAALIVAERLNDAKGPVTLILPLRGLREDTLPGQALHDPETDRAIFDVLRGELGPHVLLVEVEDNINSPAFSERAAAEMIALLRAVGPREA